MTKALTLAVDADGIATLTLDVPGTPVNTLATELNAELEAQFLAISTNDAIRAVVLVSGKKDNFIAGADVEMLSKIRTAEDAATLSRNGQVMVSRLEGSKKPIVAAINGVCLGGGLEVALACHYRIATDDNKTSLGLPEVQLGLLPGTGGTQRLPRLIGLVEYAKTGRKFHGG